MASSYPNTIEAFIALSGTSKLSSPDHTVEHTLERDNIVAIETVVGTTAGTNVLKNFAAGDFPVRINASNVLQQALTGTASITAGTLSGVLIGTSTITGGTANAVTLGTPTIGDFTNATHTHATNAQGGTVSHTALSDKGTATHTQIDSHLGATGTAVHGLGNMSLQNSDAIAVTGGTLSGALIGTSQITGGSIASAVIGTPTITGGSWSTGTITSSVLGTPTVTGGSWSTGTITASTLGTPTITGGSWSTGTIANAVVGSPSVTGGTIANALLGTSTITGGTASAIKITSGTLSGVLVGTSTITGGTASAMLLGTSTITGGTISGALIGTSQITGGSISTATIGTPTIIGGTMGTSTVTGGTINTATIGTPNITGGTATLLTPVDVLPVDLKLSTASKGGVFNGGFELGTGTFSAAVMLYGWTYFNNAGGATVTFDSDAHSGKQSLKMVWVSGAAAIVKHSDAYGQETTNQYNIKIKANTKYRLSFWYKTNATANLTSFYTLSNDYTYVQYYSNGTFTAGVDWTLKQVEFTSGATENAFMFDVRIAAGTAWVDDIKLEEVVTDTTFTGKTVEKVRPVLTAVTSTDNIDQSYLVSPSSIEFGGTTIRYHSVLFVPTKKYLTGISLYKMANTGTPTGTITVSIRNNNAGTPGTTIIASTTYTPAQWNALTDNTYNITSLPCILTAGTTYHIVADGGGADASNYYNIGRDGGNVINNVSFYSTNGTDWTNEAREINFKTHYAKKSETYSLVVNGIKTEMKADKDGLLTGSIIDLDNATYTYRPYAAEANFTVAESLKVANDIFEANAGARGGTADIMINNWLANSGGGFYPAADTLLHYLTIKVNTIFPVKHLKVRTLLYSATVAERVQVSSDNVNWTDVAVHAVAGGGTNRTATDETDVMNGLSSFYVRFYKDAGNAPASFGIYSIIADIDTSKLPTGIFYPLTTNQFTETVTLPSVATRVYFQTAKYTNEYGVVVPALEYTDASAVVIGYTPLKLDNSQETNPSVRILSTTTNYQVSGTGSSDGGYVLNTGEYITLSTAIASIKVDYQVGTGTTAFSNITKNTIYYSSNGEGNDSTQDPSHQMSVDLGIRQQGALQRISDIGEEIQKVRDGVLKTTSWTDWTPTLTWTTGTPEGSVVTKARYKILDGVCYFAFYYSATDANGATALTISLPVLPKDNDSLTALQSQELADTTWSNPIAYIDDGGTTIVFRSFATIADTKAVKVLVSGWYEI